MRSHLTLLILCLSTCAGEECPYEEVYATCLPEEDAGRFRVISNDTIALPTSEINDASELLDAALLSFLRRTQENNMLPCHWEGVDLAEPRDSTSHIQQFLPLENFLPDLSIWFEAQDFFDIRNLGEISKSCSSSFEISEDTPERLSAIRSLHKKFLPHFSEFRDTINSTGEVYPASGWTFFFDGQTCALERLTVTNVRGKWALKVGVTNTLQTESLPDRSRLYLDALVVFEVTSPDLRTAFQYENIPVRIATAGNVDRSNRGPLGVGTIVREERDGIAAFSSLTHTHPSENTAVIAALGANKLLSESTSDTMLPSNLVLLALPMVSSFVPSSVFRFRSWRSVFIYVVVTDCVTTLPFIVKGIEVISQRTKTSYSTIAYYVGEPSTSQYLEVLACGCSLREKATPGIVFVVVGFIVILVGLVVEVVARKREQWTNFPGLALWPGGLVRAWQKRERSATNNWQGGATLRRTYSA